MPDMNSKLHSVGQPLVRLENLLKLLCAAALFAGAGPAARASDPNGIYGFVDRVVMEPDDANPERIQVWGGFALAKSKNSNEYNDAERGYMYFKIRPGEEDICKKEWADLKAVAGTGQIVSFGARYEKTPATLRKADAKVENADLYPKSWGIIKVRDRDYTPLNQLKKLKDQKPGADQAPKTPGKKE
ncbi:MAG: hypothetical protein QOF48_134 [Verrucomicrobiota bacterium]|jgi:hypothetical protein